MAHIACLSIASAVRMSVEECSDSFAAIRYRIEAAMFAARSRPARPLSATARHYDSVMHARYACDARN
ncbi:hypothetical protein [Lysobacter sp. TAB13]|uniref:hypothetical protein n=1 Tax=Lysobacter sp. TAB13 TaxID=3233065 RepID=UPI003F95C33F